MTDAETLSNLPNDIQVDNFQLIRGIRPETANALYKIGIRHFSQLAQYTPESLSEALSERASFEMAPRQIRKDNWISQAGDLAMRESEEQIHRLSLQANEDITGKVTPGEGVRRNVDLVDPTHWQQHVSFSVFFETRTVAQEVRVWQTRVIHHESKEEATLPGTATVPWLSWMLEQVAKIWHSHVLHRESQKEATLPTLDSLPWTNWLSEPTKSALDSMQNPLITHSVPSTVLQPLNNIHLEIFDFKLAEVETSTVYSRRDKKLSAEFKIRLTGTEAKQLTNDQNLFQVSTYFFNMEEKTTKLIVSGENKLQPDQFEYQVHQEFLMPDPGNYECYIIALLFPPYPLMASPYRKRFNVT